MTNPLGLIKNWFNSQDTEIKKDFIGLASIYLQILDLESNDLLHGHNLEPIQNYLDSNGLNSIQSLTRVLTLKGFINFTLESRDDEQGWEEARQRNELASKHLTAKGHTDKVYQDFMKTYERRKNAWISWASDWYKLNENELSDSSLSNWFYTTLISKK